MLLCLNELNYLFVFDFKGNISFKYLFDIMIGDMVMWYRWC